MRGVIVSGSATESRVVPERIVYVEDDPNMRMIFREALERNGYQGVLVTCGSGQELLDRVKVLNPDLIVLDLKMPEMNGPDTLGALRQTEGAEVIPVLFLTGADRVVMTEQYRQLGVIGVLHKPFNTATLFETILTLYQT